MSLLGSFFAARVVVHILDEMADNGGKPVDYKASSQGFLICLAIFFVLCVVPFFMY
jgi:hypothetical protein